MKNLIIATTIALTSLVAFNAPSQAAPFSGTLAQSAETVAQNVDYRPGYRHHNRKWNRHCFVRTERHRVHGRIIIKKVRVCR
jgi:hypothetical protein